MVDAIADTHTAIWYLYADSRLSETVRQFIALTVHCKHKIGLSSISLAEIVCLVEKGRIAADTDEELLRILHDPSGVFEEIPVDHAITSALRQVSRDEVPDLPDRIIAATAVKVGVPVISRDGRIQASSVATIW